MDAINFFLAGAALAPVWMFFGVYYCAKYYPGYSHVHQVMSELGARERPTTRIHPYINNYPIAILFAVGGLAIAAKFPQDHFLQLSGVMIFLQGLAHFFTGLFPCDKDLGMSKASLSQHIHNLAGLVMLLTLLIPVCLSIYYSTACFACYSFATLIIFLLFFLLMLKEFKTQRYIGLYQRISYGALALWCLVFSAGLLFQ